MNCALSLATELLDDEILAVALGGSLNGTTTEQFNQAIQEHLGRGRTKIIIDCRNVQNISSIGIASLVALQARLRLKGGEVKLASVSGVPAEALRIVGLDKFLNIYRDLELARQAFHEPPPRPEKSVMQLP